MPARHGKHTGRLAKRKLAKSKPRVGRFIVLLLVVIVIILFSTFFLLSSFSGTGRLSLVNPDKDGNIVYQLYDFKAGTIARVIIPRDTQVDVAMNLGTWKIGSVIRLGQDQKISGNKLLSETVTKSLQMPVTTSTPNIIEKIKIAILKFNAKTADIKNIDLAQSKYLTKTKLEDGSLGYKISGGDMPFDLRATLADGDISKESATILLENATGKGYASAEINGIVDIMGGKVLSISKLDVQNIDCVVYGDKNSLTASDIAKVFECKLQPKLSNYNFDIVVRVGIGFTRRY